MRVLHVTNAYPSNIAPIKGVFIKEQIESLEQVGLQVDVFALREEGSRVGQYLAAYKYVTRNQRRYDVVHAHHVLMGVVVLLAGARKKAVVSFMNDVGRNVLRVPRFVSAAIESIVHRFCRAAIFKSPSFRDRLRSMDALLPNGVMIPATLPSDAYIPSRNRLGIESDELCLLFVSANNLNRPAKRYDRFCEVVASLQKNGIKVRELLLVSEPRSVAFEYFSAADIIIVVSEFEGSPNAVKEALARGAAVISTDVGDVSDLVNGVPDCWVGEHFSVESFCDAVHAVVTEPGRRNDRVNAFRSNVISHQQVAVSLGGLYESIHAHQEK